MSYTLREVAAMLGLSAAQIRSYASKWFLTPERGPRGARARANEFEADDWYDLARHIELTSIHEARDAYQRALQLDPHHSDAHVNLGRLFHEERELVAAEQHYRAALEIDPQHSIAAF